jgi:TatD DNase family protein
MGTLLLNTPQKIHFFDIHTHKKCESESVFSIRNYFPEKLEEISQNEYYSVGIHPWNINQNFLLDDFYRLKDFVCKPNFIAVGEIGLDKLHPFFELQKDFFSQQASIAQHYSTPIIIHCVKAFNEVFSILKKMKITVPVIFHGYNGNLQTTKYCIEKGFYFSLGKDLFRENSNACLSLWHIPQRSLFFETDDSDYTIQDIYAKAAELLYMDLEKLKQQISENFNRCFSTSF